DDDEARVRSTLSTIPLDRLREAGLLDALIRLAGTAGQPDGAAGQGAAAEGPVPDLASQAEAIRQADVDDLIKFALGEAENEAAR
ncbi:MAG TPA: hypothetical protein VH637_05730, partial [Streptosporangiaceae bacterium]